jgi:hypothetical protein
MAANIQTDPTCSLVERYITAFRINLFFCHPQGRRRQQVYPKQWYTLSDNTPHHENVNKAFIFLNNQNGQNEKLIKMIDLTVSRTVIK